MNTKNMKNVVILKDLPSNLIDEAIIVIKENKKIPKLDCVKSIEDGGEFFSGKLNKDKNEKKLISHNDIKSFEKMNKENRQYVVKEAEIVVSNYIAKVEQSDKKKSLSMYRIEKRYKKIKMINVLLGFFSMILLVLNFIK